MKKGKQKFERYCYNCKYCFFYNEGQEDCNFTTCNFLDEDEYYYPLKQK